jgi:Domain of unknown function (DUF3520)
MNLDDPRLTAYALDELDERERAEVAREVADSPEAQENVNETRTLARLLRAEFAAKLENGDGTEPTPPGKVASLSANLSDIRDDPWFWSVARPLAVAAALAIFAVIGAGAFLLSHKQETARRVVVTGSNVPTTKEAAANAVEGELSQISPSSTPMLALEQSTASAEFHEEARLLGKLESLGETKSYAQVYAGANKVMPTKSVLEKARDIRGPTAAFNTADYGHFVENAFLTAAADPLSTFSIDVLLRDSEFKGTGSFNAVREWAQDGKGSDANGYRAGFIELVRKAEALKRDKIWKPENQEKIRGAGRDYREFFFCFPDSFPFLVSWLPNQRFSVDSAKSAGFTRMAEKAPASRMAALMNCATLKRSWKMSADNVSAPRGQRSWRVWAKATPSS